MPKTPDTTAFFAELERRHGLRQPRTMQESLPFRDGLPEGARGAGERERTPNTVRAHTVLTAENSPGIMRNLEGRADAQSARIPAGECRDDARHDAGRATPSRRYAAAIQALALADSPHAAPIQDYVRRLRDESRRYRIKARTLSAQKETT